MKHIVMPLYIRVCWLLFALYVLCMVSTAFGQTLDVRKAYPAVAQLQLGNVSGTGTLVARRGDYGLILSCRHVCQRVDKSVNLYWNGVPRQPVSTGIVHSILPGVGFDTDLAVVLAKVPPGVRPVAVTSFDPNMGPWHSVGYRTKVFAFSRATTHSKEGNLIILNAPYIGGMSGGPTFDRKGRIVAVAVGADERNMVGVSVDGAALQRILETYRGE